MYIEQLECKNFRNYESARIDFSPGINILHGNNAQGKTNLLEAIRLCATTRSHRLARDAEMIRFGSDEAHLRLILHKESGTRRLDLHLRKAGPKGVAIDGVPIRRASELMGTLHTVLFSPEDLAIIKEGPKERRRFFDAELCQLSGAYFSGLSEYNKVVIQRNHLLKELPYKGALADTLDVWDEQLAAFGAPIIRAREKFVEEIRELAGDIHRTLTGGKEELQLYYEPDAEEDNLAAQIAQYRERDRQLRTTTTGPHRDDLAVKVNGIDLRKYGSQGQQRSAALSLKMAEIELVRRRTGETPVLLLDDVLSELDASRQEMLLAGLKETQTFITCTGVEDFLAHGVPADRTYLVEAGTIKQP